jgi:hypothetical protein
MTPVTKLVAVAAAGTIFAAGVWWGGPDRSGTVALPAVQVFGCPGGAVVGEVGGGDRVLATGQDATGAWVEIRSPLVPDARVWVEADLVDPDRSFAGLPVVACPPESVALGDLTDVVPGDDETTTTTEADVTTTTVPGVTTTTTTQATTTTTTAPDTTPPVIANQNVTPTTIGHDFYCPPPHVATVSAFVTDNVGVSQVRAIWTIPGLAQETRTMSHAGGGTYSGEIGPYEWPQDGVDEGQHQVIVTIEARDAAGNLATATTSFTFRSAEDCFG